MKYINVTLCILKQNFKQKKLTTTKRTKSTDNNTTKIMIINMIITKIEKKNKQKTKLSLNRILYK